MGKPVDSILIAGSGFAAWASAAMLARATAGRVALRVAADRPDADTRIEELMGSCRPAVAAAHYGLDIDESGFMRATGATFKLATVFQDFRAPGESYLHAFGDIGARLDSVAFHQLLNRARLAHEPIPRPDQCSLAAVAARAGRFTHPAADNRSVTSTYDYAYQFDVAAATAYFRALAERQGVRMLAGHIRDVGVGADGFLQSVTLEGGERVTAQLFLDCSGAHSRLLGQALGVPFDSWSRWLPCDRVVHLRTARAGDPPPATLARACAVGWQLQLPLQSQDVHALFYASAHCTDEAAARELGKSLGLVPDALPASATLASGRRRKFWVGNCMAIGAAGGVVDPLASTSVQLIYNAIARLTSLLPQQDCAAGLVGEYERLTTLEYERALEFAALPYCTSLRVDSPFWRACRAMSPPPILDYRLKLFRRGGRLAAFDDELFEESDWVSVLLGQGVWPALPDPLTLSLDAAQLASQTRRMAEIMRQAAEAMPTHQRYLEQLGISGGSAPRTGSA
ncbi:MAG: tryptophan halogenase family protein [Pseudomonadota bacterium]